MSENKEIITGSDFKRMIAGAYSAFLLEYENINSLDGTSLADQNCPGTNMLRTMGSAAMAIRDISNDSIGAIACSVSNCAVLGARGNSGVLLAQIFRGIAKGLAGKYDVDSSVFGKAFQFGILYAHRTSVEEAERSIIITAKAVAKGAYKAVRANRPISDILAEAIKAGDEALKKSEAQNNPVDAGAKALMVLLQGCQSGLDGNFVSPVLIFSSGTKKSHTVPEPENDIVRPYCVQLTIYNCKAAVADIKKILAKYGNMVVIERKMHDMLIHLHMERPGLLVEQITGWGNSYDIHVDNMADLHKPLILGHPLNKLSILAVASDEKVVFELQDRGALVIMTDTEKQGLAVGNFVNTVHSDIAEKYIILSNDVNMNLMLYQAKRLLGKRIEVIYSNNTDEQLAALKVYDEKMSLEENAKKMENAIRRFRRSVI
ncbi:DAK2 domain-containing protein [Pectinatus haikarae]|uniref:Dihydroxyacetone kinase-like predicted kinase n=1 Tax=Pectinatus haikarae TaxID=349096 RepID=A0ABT9Y7R3_9FIRM|nr:DAK2 domain-containing protein [Pectinatus haikarae]MDQ0203875.1 dihydroxyacetone kinase-like predicted kinase [Pectinatus haikarae]